MDAQKVNENPVSGDYWQVNGDLVGLNEGEEEVKGRSWHSISGEGKQATDCVKGSHDLAGIKHW